MVEVYLARHGQTEENVCRIFQGHLPGRLTDEGKLQAIALGEYLKDIPLDGILSSDLDRVVETVRLAVGSRHLPWQITPLLREINWGSWTGLPIDSVDKSCYPENAETREMLYHRAEQAAQDLLAHALRRLSAWMLPKHPFPKPSSPIAGRTRRRTHGMGPYMGRRSSNVRPRPSPAVCRFRKSRKCLPVSRCPSFPFVGSQTAPPR